MKAYLFRGLAGRIFSTGIDRLAEELAKAGVDVSVHCWADRRAVEKDAIKRHRADKHPEPIVLAGHSLGANAAVAMANGLAANRIPVSYVATIDPTSGDKGPKGVPLDNFRSWDPRSRSIKGATEFRRPDLNHIQIDKDRGVHQRILAMCLATRQGESADREIASSSIGLTQHEYPVRDALGSTAGKLLDGRKTASGLVVALIAALLPQLAGIQPGTNHLFGGAAWPEILNSGYAILFPAGLALTGWGLLGKFEKWLKFFN